MTTSNISARWTKLVAASRLCRSSHILSASASRVLIFGGELLPRQPVDNHVDQINVDTELKAKVDTLPAPDNAPSARVGSASVTIDGSIWLFSGRGGLAMDAIEENGSIWRFDGTSSTWQRILAKSTTYPTSRSYHAMAFDGEKTIYLHAGCPSQGRLSDLWAFDIETLVWIELPSAPGPARGGTSIAFCDGKLYRMGGFDGKSEQGGELDIYDPDSQEWHTITFPSDGVQGPEARSVATLLAVRLPGKESVLVTMFGERDPSSLGHAGAGKMLDDVWIFNAKSSTWSKAVFSGENAPAARGWFAADVMKQQDGDAVIVQGGLAEDNTRLGDAWRLDFL
ncbi:kelch domain-containing protein [Trichoderma velutinum]